MTVGSVGWGICSTGKIATGFARNLAEVPGARIAGVASRAIGTATTFAREHGDDATRSYASVEELAADPAVDVVYVASPHTLHPAHARAALEAGKAVLCEKPLTLNARQAQELVDLARDRGVFFMEAMWMACNPVVRELVRQLASGRFGTPRQVRADLGFRVERPPTDRLLAPELGGGALLDMGIYPLTLAHLVLGPAETLTATADLSDTGIDLDVAIAGRYAGGAVAALSASITSACSTTATIATTEGTLTLPRQFHHPAYVDWSPTDGEPERIDAPGLIGTGLGNEAAEVQRCLAEGLMESPMVPHEQTLTLMRQLDAIRGQIGLVYPGDDPVG
jgi:predicted dehydrogenase